MHFLWPFRDFYKYTAIRPSYDRAAVEKEELGILVVG